MNTDLLKSFLEVARQGSYTRAAEELYLSQPAVYQHVKTLEKVLHTRLVQQAGKRVLLTAEGRALAPYARRVLDAQHDLESAMTESSGVANSRLTIVAGTTIGESVLPAALASVKRRYPQASVHLELNHDPHAIDQSLLRFQYDGGFHSSGLSRAGLIKEAMVEDRLLLVVPQGHRLSRRRQVSASDLRREGIISHATPFGVRSAVDAWAGAQGVVVPSYFEVQTQPAITIAVAGGAGVAIVSSISALPYLRSRDVVGITLKPPLSRYWYFIYPAEQEVAIALRVLTNELSIYVERTYALMNTELSLAI